MGGFFHSPKEGIISTNKTGRAARAGERKTARPQKKGLMMAISKCGSCGNHLFELVQNEPRGSAFKLYFVQCSSCGAVVGTQEYYSTHAILKNHAELLKKMAQALNVSFDWSKLQL